MRLLINKKKSSFQSVSLNISAKLKAKKSRLPPLLRAYLPHTTHIGTTTTIIPLKFFSRAGSFNTKQHYILTWQFSEISLKTNSNGLFTSYTRLNMLSE